MPTDTYYTTLGLVASADPAVIRAAYKALSLVHHPDKTLHLAADKRASHAAVFKKVQEAYDVLSNPSLKASYDAELARHNNKVNEEHSTFHRPMSSRTASAKSSSSGRQAVVKLTTPEEKASLRAKARQSLEHLRNKRAEREIEDANIDVAGLENLVQIWSDLAIESKTDPSMQAHCTIRVHEYEQKIAQRQQQHEELLPKTSTATMVAGQHRTQMPKTPMAPSASMPASRSNTGRARAKCQSTTAPSPIPASRSRLTARAEERKRAEAAVRAQARLQENAQRKAAKQVQVEQKVAAVRAEKEQQKARAELQTQKDADRIAAARAKAGAAPLGTVGAAGFHHVTTSSEPERVKVSPQSEAQAGTSAAGNAGRDETQSHVKKVCGKCGLEHPTFREWRKCNMQAAPISRDDDGSFLWEV
jgi:curved DNA-binding protein CbpA